MSRCATVPECEEPGFVQDGHFLVLERLTPRLSSPFWFSLACVMWPCPPGSGGDEFGRFPAVNHRKGTKTDLLFVCSGALLAETKWTQAFCRSECLNKGKLGKKTQKRITRTQWQIFIPLYFKSLFRVITRHNLRFPFAHQDWLPFIYETVIHYTFRYVFMEKTNKQNSITSRRIEQRKYKLSWCYPW